MLENILAWIMAALAIPALLAGAVVMVAILVVAAALSIPYLIVVSIIYLVNGDNR
jgi:hypothetical protein